MERLRKLKFGSFQHIIFRTFLVVYWLRLQTSLQEACLILVRELKISHATQQNKQNKTNPLNRQTEKPKNPSSSYFKNEILYYVVLKDFLQNTVSDLPYINYRKLSLYNLNAESSPYYQLSHQTRIIYQKIFPLIF